MRIRYGAIITDGVGKIGGQFIQRSANNRVLRNITIPINRHNSMQNPQKFVNSLIFSKWSLLSQLERDLWVDIAAILKGKNTWGEEKNYTPRQAFTMCNAVYYPFDNRFVDPSTFDFTASVLNTAIPSVNAMDDTFIIPIVFESNVQFYQLKSLRLANSAQFPDVRKMKTFARMVSLLDPNAVYEYFLNANQNVKSGDYYAFAFRSVSRYGLFSAWNVWYVRID